MIRDWKVACKDCGRLFTYSDQSARDAAVRGESRPERCVECRSKHNRQTSRMGAAYVDLDPGDRPVVAGELKAGRLGRLDRGSRPHRPQHTTAPTIGEGTFGITDDHIGELLDAMEQHQVVVVEAPTGSGKSTFLPWRLLNPPAPYPGDTVTRHGLIVVTQPRIEATQGIPRYIAGRLHGAAVGAGVDIGYRHSAARDQADSRNRLVYTTDGTLLNMIRRGELHGCSTVIIDEAHERSLNIDLILALLRRELVALPQLRLLIVSATIDTRAFAEFFRPEIRSTTMRLPGKQGKPVYERWRSAPEIPLNQWAARMPGEVAGTAYEVLRWMASGERPPDVPEDVPTYQGDLLVFLPGRRAINAVINDLEESVGDDEDLAGKVQILPLYAELSQAQRTRALTADRRPKGVRWRVIVATNIAETSLTVDGVRHVIDSGLINTTEWDPATLTTIVRPKAHSQSGLRQRRGRAGRTAPGVWHCLFSRDQFDQLPFETPPEIVRAPLERVVLTAAAAGVSDPASLRWLAPGPPIDEMRRAYATLRGMGAVTADGDPTPFGSELASSRESFDAAAMLMCADEAGVAVEAATVLAAMHDRQWVKALHWSSGWPAITRLHADRLHTALLSDCVDDLDTTLLLVHEWERLRPDEQDAAAQRYLLSAGTLNAVLRRREGLLQSLQSRTKTAEVRPIEPGLADRLRRVIAWAGPNAIYQYNDDTWQAALVPRADPDVVARLHQGARPVMDADTLLSRTADRPEYLIALVRDRRRRWTSPLQEPEEQVTLSFCVALRGEHLAGDVPLLAHIAGQEPSRPLQPPTILPGERVLVEPVGQRSHGTQVRVLATQPPVAVPDIELAVGDDTAEESGDLTQREAVGNDLSGLDPDLVSAADYLVADDDTTSSAPGTGSTDEPVNLFAGLEVVVDQFDPNHPIVAVTAVVDGTVYAAQDPIAAVERFTGRFGPGDECVVQVTEIRPTQRDRRRILIAREEVTGVEIPLTGYDVGSGVRDTMLESWPVGTRLRLAVVATDTATGLVQLSALPWIASAMARLADAGGEPFAGTVVDARNESLYVCLTPDGTRLRADDPPVAFEFRADDLPARPTEMAIGQQVRVRLGKRPRRTASVDLDLPDLRLPTGPFQRTGRSLTLSGPAAPRDILAMYRAAGSLPLDEAVAVHRALGLLLARALRQRARIIDVTGIIRLGTRPRWSATVLAVADRQVTVEVDGITTNIPSNHLAWPGQQPPSLSPGGTVDVHVTEVDPEQGRVLLTLRDPAKDPLAGLTVGDVLTGQVVRAERAGLRVAVARTGTEVFVPARETLVRRDLETVLPVGSTLRVRLIEINTERRNLIGSRVFQQAECPLPDDIVRLIQADRGPDVNRLRALTGPSADLRIDAGKLVMRWTDEPSNPTPWDAQRAIETVASGQLSEIDVPHTGPLDVPARERLSRQFGCLVRLDRRSGGGERPNWTVIVAHPQAVPAETITAALVRLYPYRIRATNLQTDGTVRFNNARQAFQNAERERRARKEPASLLFRQDPYNYVDIGTGDTWDGFAARLTNFGLILVEPQWIYEDRITVRSSRPM
nr:hypothetical protein GCM10020063_010370 [Dactylosporangium thailandense]